MKKAILVIMINLLVMAGFSHQAWCRDTGTWLKSSYLKSIHDDCRTLLEGIELFNQRDYAEFIKDIQNGDPVNDTVANNYTSELKYFQKLLDSLYEEYVSLKTSSAAEAPPAGDSLSDLEKSLCQMFAYAYIRTGDVIMAQYLMRNKDILSENFTINIRNIEGILVPFPLTENLKKEARETTKKLAILTLTLTNFMEEDRQEINAYLKISGYDKKDPANILYLEYYGRHFPGLKESSGKMIHIGSIVEFLNTVKYRTAAAGYQDTTQNDNAFQAVYQFPIIKGDYELIVRDPQIRAFSPKNDAITIDHLCFFKGLARTDFRNLKQEEKEQQATKTFVEQSLSLLKPGKTYVTYKPGQMVPYGVYALYEKDQHLGTVNLLPCSKGGQCKDNKETRKDITPVRIFDHTFLLSRDVLDLITRNNRIYKTSTPEPVRKPRYKKEITVFPGCTTVASGHGEIDVKK